MTSPASSSMDTLLVLLEERRRYEGWLSQLEVRRGETPTHVLERVRQDYDQRLQAVVGQLRTRTPELESIVRTLRSRSQELLSQENSRRDDRIEAGLRGAVGEYSPEETRERMDRCDEEISRLAAERNSVDSEFARWDEVLSLVKRSGNDNHPRITTPPAVTPAPTPSPALTEADAAAAFDEVAFLQTVGQPRAASVSGNSGNYPSPPSVPVATPSSRPPADAAVRESGSQSAFAVPSGTPAFLKEVPGEQVKTLKCQECGTMNYPTEWYCERCGGELAAM